jgi:hypothetical protein
LSFQITLLSHPKIVLCLLYLYALQFIYHFLIYEVWHTNVYLKI